MNYYKAKKIFNSNFDKFEVRCVNFAVKFRLNYKAKFKYLNKQDKISREYSRNIIKYWQRYLRRPKTHWHRLYTSRNRIEDVRYIPDDLYYTKIDQYFNNRKYGWGVNDKNYYSLWFEHFSQPLIVIRKINGIFYDKDYKITSLDEAINHCLKYSSIIIKPSVETGGGRGIVFWKNTDSIEKLQESLDLYENLCVQETIIQHKSLSDIHPDSVNTVRVISLLWRNQIVILSSILRMGINGSKVDNASAGGITCGIFPDGKLKSVAYSAHGDIYLKHPQGYVFSNCVIPSFQKILEFVRLEHEKMGHFRLISWDIAVDRDSIPILIEANLRNGEIDFHQFNNGPLFGDITEEVLDEIFGK